MYDGRQITENYNNDDIVNYEYVDNDNNQVVSNVDLTEQLQYIKDHLQERDESISESMDELLSRLQSATDNSVVNEQLKALALQLESIHTTVLDTHNVLYDGVVSVNILLVVLLIVIVINNFFSTIFKR